MRFRDVVFGVVMALVFIGFFLLMKAVNLYENFNLRVINVVFHFGIVYIAVRTFIEEEGPEKFNYISGSLAGIKPSIISVILFSLFQVFYLNVDHTFFSNIQENVLMGQNLTPLTTSLVLAAEGLAISLPISYVAMRIVDHQYDLPYRHRSHAN